MHNFSIEDFFVWMEYVLFSIVRAFQKCTVYCQRSDQNDNTNNMRIIPPPKDQLHVNQDNPMLMQLTDDIVPDVEGPTDQKTFSLYLTYLCHCRL